jgi:hypothetical protein
MTPMATKRVEPKTKEAPADGRAKVVYNQLAPDFPSNAIQWVLRNDWIGPYHVDLDEIDTSNRANWTASQEPKKVKMHQDLIEQGKSKPIILAQLPHNDKLVILDAHHRYLAYEALGQEPLAYIVDVRPADVEQALTMHSHQWTGGSKLNGT